MSKKGAVIGVFDGVHRGHASLIRQFIKETEQRKLSPIAISFDPPPSLFFNPQFNFLLSTKKEKEARLKLLGIKEVVFLNFKSVVNKEPQNFIESQLYSLGITFIMVGASFHFGKKRKGNVETLEQVGANFGFTVKTIGKEKKDGEPISATRIRELLLLGHIRRANELLGYEYQLEGIKEKGLGRAGALLNTPTVNMQPCFPHKLLPPDGIYAVRFGRQAKPGVCYIGSSPSFGDSLHRIEVHLLDEPPSLAEEPVVCFVERIRPEMTFSCLDELKHQVADDVKKARRVLSRS